MCIILLNICDIIECVCVHTGNLESVNPMQQRGSVSYLGSGTKSMHYFIRIYLYNARPGHGGI